MAVATLCIITWIVIIVFAIVRNRFTLVEIVFLYFTSCILTVTIFAILVVNLQWVPAGDSVEKAIALDICRFVEIPLLLILSADVLNSSLRRHKRWLIATLIGTLLVINDWILVSLGILEFRKWNYFYDFIAFLFFISTMSLIARWFNQLKQGGVKRID